MNVDSGNNSQIRLSVLPLSEIRPHERIIPALLESLRQDMQRTGFQRDPILVDSRSYMALDGMHRRAALELLGAKFALCSEFDYQSDSVKLERWLRYIIAPSKELVRSIVSLFKMEKCDALDEAIQSVDSGKSGISLLSGSDSYASQEKDTGILSGDVRKVYELINSFDGLCDASGVTIEFAPEEERRNLFSSHSVYVLYPASLTKKDILHFAERKEALPFKTTRHIVPIRPMGVYFPLHELCKASLSECNLVLREILDLSTVEIENKNIWYEGRRYGEKLAIYRRKKQSPSLGQS